MMPRPSVPDTPETLEAYLYGELLPFWLERGTGDAPGSVADFFDAELIAQSPQQRLRCLARQIHVFSHAAMEAPGRNDEYLAAARASVDYLTAHYLHPEGGWRENLSSPETDTLSDIRTFYDQAFVLLAMASYYGASGETRALEVATQTFHYLEETLWQESEGSYVDSHADALSPEDSVVRQQNPHMHLLEACLEMLEFAESQPEVREVYEAKAEQLIALFRERFIDPEQGFLYEAFTADGSPRPETASQEIEPGHQFEWVWLLHRYAGLTGDETVIPYADGLYEFAVQNGVDRGTYGEMKGIHYQVTAEGDVAGEGDFHGSKRVWAQTEALKAFAVRWEQGDELAGKHLQKLLQYCFTEHVEADNPLWREHLSQAGEPLRDTYPATSVYHIALGLTETIRVQRERGQEQTVAIGKD